MDARTNRLFARIKHLELVSNKLAETLLSGHYRSVFRGPGIEFSEVREYAEGDDTRLIDWNVTGRMNNAYTRTFREERELTLFLLVDMSASMLASTGSSDLREMLETIVAVFTFGAINNNDQVGAVFFTDQIEHWVPAQKGKRHGFRLVQDLLAFKPQGRGSDLASAIRTSADVLKRRGICIIISDFKSSAYQKDLSLLARRHDVIAIRLAGHEEQDFPAVGLATLADPEMGKTITVLGTSRSFRRRHHEYWLAQRQQWLRECRRRRVDPLEISANDDPIVRLFQFFERRKRR